MYATVQNVHLKVNRQKKRRGVPVMDSIKEDTTNSKGPGDGTKEKMRARSIVECFSSSWKGDI